LHGLFNGGFLLLASRSLILDVTECEGYGWFKAYNKRFDAPLYYMNWRAWLRICHRLFPAAAIIG
jgi:hypothetical protein